VLAEGVSRARSGENDVDFHRRAGWLLIHPTIRVRYRRTMQRSLMMTTTPDLSGVRLLLP